MRLMNFSFSLVALAGLAACGGGDSASVAAPAPVATSTPAASTPAASTPAPAASTPAASTPAASTPAAATTPVAQLSTTSTPSAVLVNSQAEGQKAIDEANAGYASAQSAASGAAVKPPFGNAAPAPGLSKVDALGVVVSAPCPSGGSITYDVPVTAITATGGFAAGTSFDLSFSNCNAGAGVGTINGTARITFSRYNSATDMAYTAVYNNFTVSGVPGVTGVQNFNATFSCSISGTNASCNYNDGARAWSSGGTGSVSYTNGTASGTYAVNYSGGGTVRVTFTNYSATSGTAVIEGSNGAKWTIKRCSATAFTVTYTNGTTTNSYSYGGGCA